MLITEFESVEVILKELGRRIKNIRINRGLTQRELSAKAGVSAKSVENIEKGENINFDTVIRILRVFNMLSILNDLIPEEVLRAENFVNQKERQRVRKSKKENAVGAWKWGDDK